MRKRNHEECGGFSSKLTAAVLCDRGHSLAIADDELQQGVLICIRCGCYATSEPKGLLEPCKRGCARHSAGHQALQRVAARKHPRPSKATRIIAFESLGHEEVQQVWQALDKNLAKVSAERPGA
eukprot:10698304-Karenia_brevis.AAC.1